MHIAEVVTIAKSLPLLRLNTYKSLILSYSADYRRIFRKKGFFKRNGLDQAYYLGKGLGKTSYKAKTRVGGKPEKQDKFSGFSANYSP